eukprot:CAMPEP_0185802756 /NCGR_PEP_ID=MMETSP1322-20130828/2176_1 /TAXON_ID=265543 /ORGANISM="Minutocellus polymorphus, Strain RCC2270" /LENGTH=339 /DNA_ID=CAMNT_0028498531 /DNA_START=110 /DNA_END=1129 /DNA_ORIENTATION=-
MAGETEAEGQTRTSKPEGGPDEQDDAAARLRPPRPSPSREELSGISTEEANVGEQSEDDLEAAPLHLHTLREPALLRGLPSSSVRARSRSGSRSRTSSRDASPSPMDGNHHRRKSSGLMTTAIANFGTPAESIPGSASAAPTTQTTASSVSGTASDAGSDLDPDIFLDRLGFDSDLEPPSPHEITPRGDLALGSTWGHSSQPMPSLNERMTEDSLEDAGAFADLVSTLHTSLRAHALNEEIEALGILDEAGEEADDEGGSSDEDEAGAVGAANSSEGGDVGQHPAVQVLDDLLVKVTDPAERAKLLKLKRDHSDKIEAAIRGIADIERRASMDANDEEE